jgi:tryptophanyl-tRNA synthetase
MAIENVNLSKLIQSYAGMEFKKFKEDLADCLVSKISKITSEMRRLLSDNQYLDSILSEGSMNAQEIARKNISDIKKLIGFYKS